MSNLQIRSAYPSEADYSKLIGGHVFFPFSCDIEGTLIVDDVKANRGARKTLSHPTIWPVQL